MTMDISDEWATAIAELTEGERAAFDDPQAYADTTDGTRL